MVEFLLKNGADTEISNEKGRTPLGEAVLERDCQSFRLLIANGATITRAIFHATINEEAEELFRISVEHLGDNLLTVLDFVTLECIALHNNSSMMRTVLGCPSLTKEWIDENAGPAAYAAVRCNSWETFECMIGSGRLDPNHLVEPQQRSTFLHLATRYGHEKIVRTLLLCPKIKVHEQDYRGRTPLEESIIRGRADIVRLLLYHSISDAQKIKSILWTHRAKLIHGAVRRGYHAIVQLLLELDSSDLNITDILVETLLSIAISKDDHEMVEILLSNTNLALNLGNGDIALHIAAQTGSIRIIQCLRRTLDEQHAWNHLDNNGRNALHIAVTHRHGEVIALLLGIGQIFVGTQDIWGKSPLELAAATGFLQGVKNILLYCPSRTRMFDSALKTAKDHGHDSIVEYMEEFAREQY